MNRFYITWLAGLAAAGVVVLIASDRVALDVLAVVGSGVVVLLAIWFAVLWLLI
jgi:hypothetical protein